MAKKVSLYEKRENQSVVGEEKYAECVKSLINQGKYDFLEVTKGSIKRTYIRGRKQTASYNKMTLGLTLKKEGDYASGDLTPREFSQFILNFNKKLYIALRENEGLMNLKIERFGSLSRAKNKEAYSRLRTSEMFFNIDLSSAYWQMLYSLGYIDEKYFKKYMYDDKYKQAKRLCVSFLARECKATYYNQETKTPFTITCDIEPLYNVYRNVRYQLYNMIQEIIFELPEYIEYNIDGITVYGTSNVELVKRRFKEMGLIFKTTMCFKIDENCYKYGSKIKNFI